MSATQILVVAVVAIICWKIIKLAARQAMMNGKRKYRKIRRQFGLRSHRVLNNHRPSKADIMADLLSDEEFEGMRRAQGRWPRDEYEHVEYNEMRKGATR